MSADPTATARCDLTDLLVDQCAHCRKHDLDFDPAALDEGIELVDRDQSEYGPPFPAQYPGRCTDCGQRIHEGDTIRSCVLAGGYVHDGCQS